MRNLYGNKHNKKGVALLEFAIVAPLFFGLVFNVTYAGLMLHDRHVLSNIINEKVRDFAADANQNISIMPDAAGGAGLAISNAAKDMQEVFNKANDQLFLYKLEKNGDNVTGVQISITPHEGKKSTTEQTSSYVKVTINDADVAMRVKAKLKEEAVPEIAALLCPNELDIKKEMRIEVHINKTLTVLGKEASGSGSGAGDGGVGGETSESHGDSVLLGKNISVFMDKPVNYNTEFATNIVDYNDSSNNTNRYFTPNDFESFLFDMLSTDSYYRELFFKDILGNKFLQLLKDLDTNGYFYNYNLDMYYHLYDATSNWNDYMKLFIESYYKEKHGIDDITVTINNAKLLYLTKDSARNLDIENLKEDNAINLKEYFVVQYTITKAGKSEIYNIVLNREELGNINKVANLNVMGDQNNGLQFNVTSEALPEDGRWQTSGKYFRDTNGAYERLEDVYTKVGNKYYDSNGNIIDTTGSSLTDVSSEGANIYLKLDGVGYGIDESKEPIYGQNGSWKDVYVTKDSSAIDRTLYVKMSDVYYELTDISGGIQNVNSSWASVFFDGLSTNTGNSGTYYRYDVTVDGNRYVYYSLKDANNPVSATSGVWSDFYENLAVPNSGTYALVDNKYYKVNTGEVPREYISAEWNKTGNIYTSKDSGVDGYYILRNNQLYKLESNEVYTGTWGKVSYDVSGTDSLETKDPYTKIGSSYYRLDEGKFVVSKSDSKWTEVKYDTNPTSTYKGEYIRIGDYYYQLENIASGIPMSSNDVRALYFDANSKTTKNEGIYYAKGVTGGGTAYQKLDCYDSETNTVKVKDTAALNSGYIDMRPTHDVDSTLYYGYNIDYTTHKEYTYFKIGTYNSVTSQNEYDYSLPAWQWDVIYNQQVK